MTNTQDTNTQDTATQDANTQDTAPQDTAPQDLADQARHTRTTSAGWMIQRLAGALNDAMKVRLAAHDLTFDQFVVLMILTEGDGLTQTEIGARVGFPGYTVTRVLDALSARGLVERHPDARSRRAHRVMMTAAGRVLMPPLFNTVKEMNAAFLAPLEPAERRDFLLLLGKLVAADQAVKSPS